MDSILFSSYSKPGTELLLLLRVYPIGGCIVQQQKDTQAEVFVHLLCASMMALWIVLLRTMKMMITTMLGDD
jgi:hypothetical protein